MTFEIIFLTSKYCIESCALCFVLALCLTKDLHCARRLLCKAWWLLLVSCAVQIGMHYLLDTYLKALNFTVRYTVFNLLTMGAFWAIYLRKKPCLTALLATHLLITNQFCQLLATYLIYLSKLFLNVGDGFRVYERLLSTCVIWLCFSLVCLFTYRQGRRVQNITPKEAVWFCAFGWVFYCMGRLLGRYFLKSRIYPEISALLYLLFVVEMCIFFANAMLMVRERDRAAEQARLNQLYALQLQHTDELNYLYQDLRQLRHEMKNQQLYVEHLLSERQYDALEAYFHMQSQHTEKALQMYDTGNRLVDAILWSRMRTAERLNIAMKPDVALPQQLPIQGHHLCSVLVNLLDNAIEASKEVVQPEIRVIARIQQGYLFCCVSNRVEGDILQHNPELRTTKSNQLQHGFGISSVRAIAELYGGITEFTVENGAFVATVMLLCEAESRENSPPAPGKSEAPRAEEASKRLTND